MAFKLAKLHLRWVALFAFVGGFAIFFGHVQDGNIAIFKTREFWTGLVPLLTVCVILGLLVPWLVFMVDPRRETRETSMAAFLTYWKMG